MVLAPPAHSNSNSYQQYPYTVYGQNGAPLFINQKLVNGTVLGANSVWQSASFPQQQDPKAAKHTHNVTNHQNASYRGAALGTPVIGQLHDNQQPATLNPNEQANASLNPTLSKLDLGGNSPILSPVPTNQALVSNRSDPNRSQSLLSADKATDIDVQQYNNTGSSNALFYNNIEQTLANKNSSTSLFIQSAVQPMSMSYFNSLQMLNKFQENNGTTMNFLYNAAQSKSENSMQALPSQPGDTYSVKSDNQEKKIPKKPGRKKKQVQQPVMTVYSNEECTSDTDTETDTDDEFERCFSLFFYSLWDHFC